MGLLESFLALTGGKAGIHPDQVTVCHRTHTQHSLTRSYKAQVRVSKQPNVLLYGLWEEARVPGENQAQESDCASQNQTKRLLV